MVEHPPALFLMGYLFFNLEPSIYFLRIITFILAILCIILINKIFGNILTTLSSKLLVFIVLLSNPIFVTLSTEFRLDIYIVFFILLSFYFYLNAKISSSLKRNSFLAGLFFILAVFIKLNAFFSIISFLFLFILENNRKKIFYFLLGGIITSIIFLSIIVWFNFLFPSLLDLMYHDIFQIQFNKPNRTLNNKFKLALNSAQLTPYLFLLTLGLLFLKLSYKEKLSAFLNNQPIKKTILYFLPNFLIFSLVPYFIILIGLSFLKIDLLSSDLFISLYFISTFILTLFFSLKESYIEAANNSYNEKLTLNSEYKLCYFLFANILCMLFIPIIIVGSLFSQHFVFFIIFISVPISYGIKKILTLFSTSLNTFRRNPSLKKQFLTFQKKIIESLSLVVVLLFLTTYPQTLKNFYKNVEFWHDESLNINKTSHFVQDQIPENAYIITDNQYISVLSNRSIPPRLSDIFTSTIRAEVITTNLLIDAITNYNVSAVIITSKLYSLPDYDYFETYLENHSVSIKNFQTRTSNTILVFVLES